MTAALPRSLGEINRQDLQSKLEQLEKQYDRYERKYRSLARQLKQSRETRANLPNLNQFRLSTQSGNSVTVVNRNNQSTLYLVPHHGNNISLYYRQNWRLFTTSQISISMASLGTSAVYDVFAFRDNLGAVSLEFSSPWASDTARTDALTLQDGIYVKASDATRKYLGTIMTDASGGQIDDNLTNRGLWNYYNRVPRLVRRYDGTNQWNYSVNTWRVAGNDTANQVDMVIGINEVLVRATAKTNNMSANGTIRDFGMGIGINTVTSNSSLLMGTRGNGNGTTEIQVWAEYYGYPGVGHQRVSWIEISPSGANVRSWGDHGQNVPVRSGIIAFYEG